MTQRVIYLSLILVLLVPLVFKQSLPPARMRSAEKSLQLVESLDAKKGFALLSLDFGPGTLAENQPQAEVLLEHLFRKKIPVIVLTGYALGERFSIDVPKLVAERLNREEGKELYMYGDSWISLGYRAGSSLFIQALAKSEDLKSFLRKDYAGRDLSSFPRFSTLRTLTDIILAGEFTGLVGIVDDYIQFFQRDTYVPPLIHGCTSITIPEAYIFLDSGQLKGLFEGIAGAAWYSHLLKEKFPQRAVDAALVTNTALGIGHIAIIALIALGNGIYLFQRRKGAI